MKREKDRERHGLISASHVLLIGFVFLFFLFTVWSLGREYREIGGR